MKNIYWIIQKINVGSQLQAKLVFYGMQLISEYPYTSQLGLSFTFFILTHFCKLKMELKKNLYWQWNNFLTYTFFSWFGRKELTTVNIIFWFWSANMPTTSWPMVSSISYYHVYGSSLSATRSCFASWVTNASSYGSPTGNKISDFLFFLLFH